MIWRDWFAGFVDGEGCFVVERSKHSTGSIGYTPRFSIVLRDDDRTVLETIQAQLGVGSITQMSNARRRANGTSKGADALQFRVHGRNCVEVVRALDGRMCSKKADEFYIWKQAVELRLAVPKLQGKNAERMAWFRTALQAAKKYKEIE